jgi:hypothetical protein
MIAFFENWDWRDRQTFYPGLVTVRFSLNTEIWNFLRKHIWIIKKSDFRGAQVEIVFKGPI